MIAWSIWCINIYLSFQVSEHLKTNTPKSTSKSWFVAFPPPHWVIPQLRLKNNSRTQIGLGKIISLDGSTENLVPAEVFIFLSHHIPSLQFNPCVANSANILSQSTAPCCFEGLFSKKRAYPLRVEAPSPQNLRLKNSSESATKIQICGGDKLSLKHLNMFICLFHGNILKVS